MAAAAGTSDDKGQLSVRTEGAFLFTSESVNEGHPGELDRGCAPPVRITPGFWLQIDLYWFFPLLLD